MTDIEVSVQDIVAEMDLTAKLGFDLAHQKAINKVLVKRLTDQENDKQPGEAP